MGMSSSGRYDHLPACSGLVRAALDQEPVTGLTHGFRAALRVGNAGTGDHQVDRAGGDGLDTADRIPVNGAWPEGCEGR